MLGKYLGTSKVYFSSVNIQAKLSFIYIDVLIFLFVVLAGTDGSSDHDDATYHDVHTACDEAS